MGNARSIGWQRARLRAVDVSGNRGRWLSGAFGVVASVLIHGLLVGSILMGATGRRSQQPKEPGLGAQASLSEQEPRSLLILIDAAGEAQTDDEPMESQPSRGTLLQNVRLTVLSPEPVSEPAFDIAVDADEDAAAADASTSDQEGRAKQFGLYLGQIQARIERTWMKPRSALTEASFRCRVQILQSAQGQVLEVTIGRCSESLAWQLSLVSAIERASPLPAPPDPIVFSESIQLAFEARPFAEGDAEEGFEPAGYGIRASHVNKEQ